MFRVRVMCGCVGALMFAAPAGSVDWPLSASVGDVLERLAREGGAGYVVLDSARECAQRRAPRVFPQAVPMGDAVTVLRHAAGIDGWMGGGVMGGGVMGGGVMGGGVMVWAAAGDLPSLFAAQAKVRQGGAADTDGRLVRRTASLELEGAAADEAWSAFAGAFEVRVAMVGAAPPEDRRVTVRVEDIELATALAIIGDALGASGTVRDGVVFVGGTSLVVQSDRPVDAEGWEADIREADRLLKSTGAAE